MMGYQIYGTCVRFSGYSPLFLSLPSLLVLADSAVSAVLKISTVSSLTLIINMEVVKTNTSFLDFFSGNIWWRNVFFGDSWNTQMWRRLLFLYDDVSISTCCRGVIVTTFLALLAPKTSFVVLVFFASLALVGGRLLVLVIRYVSGRSIIGLYISTVILFFFCKSILLESIFWVLEGGCSNIFAPASTVFLMASF